MIANLTQQTKTEQAMEDADVDVDRDGAEDTDKPQKTRTRYGNSRQGTKVADET